MDFVSVNHNKLKVEDITANISSVACSSISLFVGINVDNCDSEGKIYVEYDADIQSAEKSFRKICQQVRQKWKVQNIAIYHRIGIIPIQDTSFVVAISAPDFSESVQALQFVISANKDLSPVIKKDVVLVKEEIRDIVIKEEAVLDSRTSSEPDPQHMSADMVPPHLIQIKADSAEINRRINCFIERKREQANLGNIQEFRQYKLVGVDEDRCARVDALLLRRKDSKSHLRVRRVFNSWGPLTSSALTQNLQQHNLGGESSIKQEQRYELGEVKPSGIKKITALNGVEERLCNAEEHLCISGPVPKDVYERLKEIENRILYLESLSPEYFQFLGSVPHKEFTDSLGSVEKKKYSQTELNNKLQELECQLASKMR